ncbi:hypothetical protein EV356DRAFT_93113 [Viridothelium virens]|uniref:Uncharacterized protein n=1 Tax=Viridothelium virens TaxID=1048519 RepID=A0A6A6HD76_VIRVR|nr:hypothetical protein EV356DRAFT_93113 [Viridothelium virens]
MALSNEAIIGLVGIVIMCAPLVAFLLRVARRARQVASSDRRLDLPPETCIPYVRDSSALHVQDIESGSVFKLVTLRRDSTTLSSVQIGSWVARRT